MNEKTDSEKIDAAGGTLAVAKLCHVKPPSVSEWRRAGIPLARLLYLALARPDIFGPLEEPPKDRAARTPSRPRRWRQ